MATANLKSQNQKKPRLPACGRAAVIIIRSSTELAAVSIVRSSTVDSTLAACGREHHSIVDSTPGLRP